MFLTTITFLITLSVLILVHELGHFFAAKRAGIKVEEFGFGYPPRIWGKKFGKTVYSINWIPFGGFVRLYGEDPPPPEADGGRDGYERKKGKIRQQAFWAKSKKTRLVVITAGVLANFLLGIVCFSSVYSALGIPTKTDKIEIVGLAPDSPADRAGMKIGDLVLEVDGEKLNDLNHFLQVIDEKKDLQVQILVERPKDNPCQEKVLGGVPSAGGFTCVNNNLLFFLTPRGQPPEGEGPLGVVISNIEMKKYPFWQMPFRGAVEGIKEALAWTGLIVGAVGKMFANLIIRGQVPKDVAGPIGIFQMTGEVAKHGLIEVVQFIGVLSVNLAIVNILPLPALDGGRLIFVAYEAITRKRPRPSLERWINTAGMAFLIFLLCLVTINDILRMVDLSSLWSWIQDNSWF